MLTLNAKPGALRAVALGSQRASWRVPDLFPQAPQDPFGGEHNHVKNTGFVIVFCGTSSQPAPLRIYNVIVYDGNTKAQENADSLLFRQNLFY